jgi:phage tail-like protein
MSIPAPNAYRFTSAAHWARCLLDRLEVSAGRLQPIARLSSLVTPVDSQGPVDIVAADSQGRPVWRRPREAATDAVVLLRLDDTGSVSAPYDIDGSLGRSRRWVIDRRWLWAFSTDRIHRYDEATLQLDRTFTLDDLVGGSGHSGSRGSISDVAADGSGGIWLLVTAADGVQRLLHLDRKGCPDACIAVPCCACEVSWLGTVERGRVLVLLAPRARRLTLVAAKDRTVLRTVRLDGLAPCWSPSGLATDGRRRIAVWGPQEATDGRTKWLLFVLGATGDVVDGPLTDFSSAAERRRAGEPPPRVLPTSAAVWGDRVWLAATDGLWRVAPGGGREGALSADGTLLTPRLHSPRTATSRGWLRAEVAADLPQGAVLDVEFASTDDRALADQLDGMAGDPSMTSAARQEAIWSLLDHPPAWRFVVAGPTTAADPVAIPLFASQDEWLWLRLKVVTPPGAAPKPLRELRVLYPDDSLMRYLPASFRAETGDPGAVLRRLVGVLETTTQRLDDRIGSIGTLMDPATAPEGWLDYMARWLDLPWDDGLAADARRRLIGSAGELLDRRGTRSGLQTLLRGLLGEDANVRVVDLTVEHPPARLGRRGMDVQGTASLPLLLAGPPRSLPILGSRAVLGRTRLCAPASEIDPLAVVVPTLRIEITAARGLRTRLEPVLERVIAQYVPAGLRVALRWLSPGGGLRDEGNTDVTVLDGQRPATLGGQSEIGRAVLGGRPVPGGGADFGMDHRLP